MESNEGNIEQTEGPHFYFIKLKSKKFNKTYEVIWSEKFIKGVKIFNNRLLTNIIKKLESVDAYEKVPVAVSKGWLVMKELGKNMTNEEMKKEMIHSYEEIESIVQINDMESNFDHRFRLEEEKQESVGHVSEPQEDRSHFDEGL